MKEPILIGQVMTAFPVSIESSASLDEATQLMSNNRVRHLPVTRGGDLVSIISERDISLAVVVNRGLQPGQTMTVDEVSAIGLYQVDVGMPLRKVVARMARDRIGSVVVTRHGRLAGIFTAVDACRCLADQLDEEAGIAPERRTR
ncbi:MAG: CBS domain-containing protein [Pseudomonadota bacterium]